MSKLYGLWEELARKPWGRGCGIEKRVGLRGWSGGSPAKNFCFSELDQEALIAPFQYLHSAGRTSFAPHAAALGMLFVSFLPVLQPDFSYTCHELVIL